MCLVKYVAEELAGELHWVGFSFVTEISVKVDELLKFHALFDSW